MTHVTCGPTAKNRDQLRNPTLGNRVRATGTFTVLWRQKWTYCVEDGAGVEAAADVGHVDEHRRIAGRQLGAQRVQRHRTTVQRRLPSSSHRAPHHSTPQLIRQDCRACLSTAAAATQARQAATPSRPTAHTQQRHCTPRKCKHAVDRCIRLGLNFFTKRQATRVIYRLTVQTLPDGLETQFTPPDTTRTGLSCRVWRAV